MLFLFTLLAATLARAQNFANDADYTFVCGPQKAAALGI